jgi:hypothetical protein
VVGTCDLEWIEDGSIRKISKLSKKVNCKLEGPHWEETVSNLRKLKLKIYLRFSGVCVWL